MSNRTARPPRPAPAGVSLLPADGRIDFANGDWVQLTLEPTHAQTLVIAKGGAAAKHAPDEGAYFELMAPTCAAVIKAGKLTNPDTGAAIPTIEGPRPFTAEALANAASGSVTRIFKAAILIPDLIPNL